MPKEKLGGFFGNVALLDIASMHPSSIIDMNLFGPYTKRFADIYHVRLDLKHNELEKAKALFDGVIADVLKDPDITPKQVANALKIPINSVYGLTSAHFPTKFNDVANGIADRNLDNKVAKRGALFMVLLKHTVQRLGYTVVHIKTDSIKIADTDQWIIDFVKEFGNTYGYSFELESIYNKMVIVNKSTYIAHSIYGDHVGEWTATGLQFQVPYVFKTLFSNKDVTFDDLKETKSATTDLYLDMNENLPENEHDYQFVGKVGAFVPIKEGRGGGQLVRQSKDRQSYSFATGTKGWRWLQANDVKEENRNDLINMDYYQKLNDDAIKAINAISGDWNYERLISDTYISPNPESNQLLERLNHESQI